MPVRYEANLPPRLRSVVAWVLRGGVSIASALLLVGLGLWAAQGTPFPSGPTFPTTPSELVQGLGAGNPFAYLALGLLVLVVTPIVRVSLSAILFGGARDRAFTALTLFVLSMLILSIVLGATL